MLSVSGDQRRSKAEHCRCRLDSSLDRYSPPPTTVRWSHWEEAGRSLEEDEDGILEGCRTTEACVEASGGI